MLAVAFSAPVYATEFQKITHVIDGDTLITDKGENIRLLGINTPEIAHGNKPAEPFSYQAKKALSALTGQKVKVVLGKRKRDKYGRLLAHLYTKNTDGTYDNWVNGLLVKKGMAHVYSFPDNREGTTKLQVIEKEARQNHLGLWALPRWEIRQAEEEFEDQDIGRFHLVKGKIKASAYVKGITYLNFGNDWRTDFSVEIRAKDLKRFKKDGINPLQYYKGKTVLVRGHLKPVNGVLVNVSNPEQITILN